MKHKKFVFAIVIILTQSVICSDSHDVRSHQRNLRRIGGSSKSADESSLSDKIEKQTDQTFITKEDEKEVATDSSTPIKEATKADFESTIPVEVDSYKKDEAKLTEKVSNEPSGNKKRRLVEVRKTKVNGDKNNSEKIYNGRGRSENIFIAPRDDKSLPSWAIPKESQKSKPEFRILDMENYVFSDRGEFHYSYESADGTKAFERGELRHFDDNSKGTAVFGGFSYKDKQGENINLQYTADENGYRPVGDHLPTPPPIPPAIARALFHLATKSPPTELSAGEEQYKYDASKYDYNYY